MPPSTSSPPTASGLPASGERVTFSFGANWQKFLETLTEEKIGFAVESLRRFTGLESFAGQSFLDLGCGSGLFSLAAMRLGADSVVSVDIDPQCVECCRRLRDREGKRDHW